MIPITPQPEPSHFDAKVRRPGQRFLRRVPHPTETQFRQHRYWKRVLPDLRTAYREICAYCACWVPFDAGTVDHFQPKSVVAPEAYEWSNYRFAQEKLNKNKDNSTAVLDPFNIQPGWFVLDFATMFVRSNVGLPNAVETAVKRTITILKLNSDALVRLRYTILKEYSDSNINLAYLERRYPFLAEELQRQARTTSIKGTIR